MRRMVVAATLMLAAASVGAFPLVFLGNSVLQRLTRADAELLSNAIDAALVAENEGAEEHWSNPDSGARGTVLFRRASQRGEASCRLLEIRTTAQAITGGGVYELCRQPNGTWTF